MALFLGLFIPLAAALFESQYVVKVDVAGYAEAMMDPEYLTLGIIYAEGSEGSRALSSLLDVVMPKFQYFCRVVALDCSDDETICPKENIASLPALSGYQPAGLNPYTGKPLVHKRDYEGVLGQKELVDWIADNAAHFGAKLDILNIKDFLAEDLNKVLLFSNKAAVPLMYKGLTSFYRGRLEFGFVNKDQTDLQARYQVTAFPTILVITKEGLQTYEGLIDFTAIQDYLEPFASAEKRAPKLKTVKAPDTPPIAEDVLPKAEVKTVKADQFDETLEASQKLVLVHYYKNDDAPTWAEIKTKYIGVLDLIELDCSQSADWELAKTHGVKRLPSMRLFPANRKRKSQEISLDEFFEETVSKELKYTVQPVNNNSIGSYIQSMKDLEKVGFLLLSAEPLSLQFKAIASDPSFKEKMGFGYYNAGDKDILENFNLKRYPTILTFITVGDEGQMKTAEYLGPLDDFNYMHGFVDQLLVTFNKKSEDNEWKEEDVPHFNSLNFSRLCLNKGGVCVIAFLEGGLVRPSLD
jgi:hypothetical protein